MKNLFGEEVHTPKDMTSQEQKEKWRQGFVEYLNNEYIEKSSSIGRFVCGCDWLCEHCKQDIGNGCEDCYETMFKFIDDEVDYFDYDYEKWEKRAKENERKIRALV